MLIIWKEYIQKSQHWTEDIKNSEHILEAVGKNRGQESVSYKNWPMC